MEVVINGVRYAPVDVSEALKADTLDVTIVKAAEERRYTLGVAYPCLRPDVQRAADGFRDYVGESALEKAAWSWMAKHRDVGLHHRDGTSGQATVVESYIWRADPWVVKAADGSTQTINPGDWLIGCVWSEETWPMVKAGLIRGFSPQGAARRRTPSEADLAKLRS